MTESIYKSNYFNEAQQAWLLARKGKITSSEWHKLTVGGKRPMTDDELKAEKEAKGRRTTVDTLFGDGALTYIRNKVDEITSLELKEENDFKQTEWGKANEMDAVHLFEDITGLTVAYHGISNPEFIPYGDFAGGSPDGKVLNAGESAITEVKCHYDGAKHMQKLFITSIEEFKEQFWEEYCQDQMNMIVTKTENCYSISYDPRKSNPALRLKIIKVPACEEWRKDFHVRHDAALDILANYIEKMDKYLII